MTRQSAASRGAPTRSGQAPICGVGRTMVSTSPILISMDPEIPTSDYREIEELIASDDSPVGIDAKKTHIIILHKLLRIEARLEQIERLVGRDET